MQPVGQLAATALQLLRSIVLAEAEARVRQRAAAVMLVCMLVAASLCAPDTIQAACVKGTAVSRLSMLFELPMQALAAVSTNSHIAQSISNLLRLKPAVSGSLSFWNASTTWPSVRCMVWHTGAMLVLVFNTFNLCMDHTLHSTVYGVAWLKLVIPPVCYMSQGDF